MAYSKEQINQMFSHILIEIEKGRALRRILNEDSNMPSTQTFYIWLQDIEKSKQYARATEIRADAIFDEIIEIADDSSRDEIELEDRIIVENREFINRSRLRVDARKWIASKLNPKKYGDKSFQDITVREQPPLFKLDEDGN